MPPQLSLMDPEQHAHPVVAMMGGIVLGLIMGGISVYYWEEMLQLQAVQDAQEQQEISDMIAQDQMPATSEAAPTHLGDVKTPFK